MATRDVMTAEQRDRERRNALYQREVSEWTDEEIAWILAERYAPTEIPPCRICGAELSIQAIGGGEPTRWACDGREDDPTRPGERRFKEGRSCADEHYSRSQFIDCRQGGDEVVIEMLRRATEQDRRTTAAVEARIVAWLRERAAIVRDGEIPEAGEETADTYEEAADAIERGDDQEGGGDGV